MLLTARCYGSDFLFFKSVDAESLDSFLTPRSCVDLPPRTSRLRMLLRPSVDTGAIIEGDDRFVAPSQSVAAGVFASSTTWRDYCRSLSQLLLVSAE